VVLSTINGQLDVGDFAPFVLRVVLLAGETTIQLVLKLRDPTLDSNSGGDVVRLHAEYYVRGDSILNN
jgi:hypothetical protein